MPTEYEFAVFISYSSNDKEWVRGELLERIESFICALRNEDL